MQALLQRGFFHRHHSASLRGTPTRCIHVPVISMRPEAWHKLHVSHGQRGRSSVHQAREEARALGYTRQVTQNCQASCFPLQP